MSSARRGPGKAIKRVTRVAPSDEPPSSHRRAIRQVAIIHGGGGPFAMAGYRIGEHALRELAAHRGSFTLTVVHETPAEVQWSCVADGLQAATGTSPGRLNLKVIEVAERRSRTLVRDRRSGRGLAYVLAPTFIRRFANLPWGDLGRAGTQVLSLSDDEIFEFEEISAQAAL